MVALMSRKSVVLAKIETTEGTDAGPSPSTDAVLVESPKMSFKPNVTSTNEVTSSLDDFGSIVGGMTAEISFDVYLKGTVTPGTAPEWGKLLKACGFAETLTSAAIPVAAEACAAGGTTTTAVLGTSASSTAQIYRGMPLLLTGTVAGTTFISDYAASKTATLTDTMSGAIVATTSYQIPANALYTPASASIPSLTLYVYNDGVLYKFVGARGNVQFALTSGGPGKMSFTFTAMFSAKIDATLPAAAYDATRPAIWKGGTMTVGGKTAAVQAFSLNMQNQLVTPDNPNSQEGYDPAVITKRDPQGSINPLEVLVATRDIMGDFRSMTRRALHARYGSTAGNRIAVTVPQSLYLNQTPNDRNGLSAVDVPYEAVGQDSGAMLCVW